MNKNCWMTVYYPRYFRPDETSPLLKVCIFKLFVLGQGHSVKLSRWQAVKRLLLLSAWCRLVSEDDLMHWYTWNRCKMWWLQEAVSGEDSDQKQRDFQLLVHQLPPPHYRSVRFTITWHLFESPWVLCSMLIFVSWLSPSPPADIIWAMIIFRRIRRKIVRTVLCCIVYNSCEQWYAHTHEHWAVVGSRPSDHYFRSVCWFFCLSVCLFVCAEFFWAIFDPISIKLAHMLYVRV